MSIPQIVIDTNVIIAALRSNRGASYKLLLLLGNGRFEANMSAPLALEYEDAAKRLLGSIALNAAEIEDILDYIFSVTNHHEIFYLWRPFLKDPKDDMVLELAVKANCNIIVTYNKGDFQELEQFGIRAMTAKEFLQEIGEL